MATLLVALIATLSPLWVSPPAAEAAYYRPYVHCTGPVGGTCWNTFHQAWPTGMYCSSSVGCFYYAGRNWTFKRWPYSGNWTQSQLNCVAGIVVTGIGFYTGPFAITAAGGAVTAWGCALSW
jgi:hypothetical protein